MADATNTTNPPLHGMSVEEIEAAIKKHWIYADFYLAEILAGTATVEETRADLQSLIRAALADGDA
jgi:hypothetical protein